MRLSSSEYIFLYEKLWVRFHAAEWKENHTAKRYSQRLWQVCELAFKEKILRGSDRDDERYLYRIYNEIRQRHASSVVIDDIVFCNVWEYFGYQVAHNVKNKGNLRERTKNLREQFVEVYSAESDIAEDAGSELETEHQGIQVSSLKNNHQRAIYSNLKQTHTYTTSNNLVEKVMSLITDFLEKIGSREYEAAWELLTPAFQDRRPWHGDVARFAKGYTNTLGIRDTVVFKVVQRNEMIFDALVYYNDETDIYTCAELGALHLMTVGDLQGFVQSVNSLKQKVESGGGSGLENIQLYRLFDQAASEHIWSKCMGQSEDIAKVFPVRKRADVKRLCQCTCKMVDDRWLIHDLRSP